MKTMLLGFFIVNGTLTPGAVLHDSELACMVDAQRVEDGEVVTMVDQATGVESPPLVLAVCVDPQRRLVMRAVE